MNIKFHLYSSNANCLFCLHRRLMPKMDQSNNKLWYCGIISSLVEEDYYCDFYILKVLEKKEKLKIKKL